MWNGELCTSNLTPALLPTLKSVFRTQEGRERRRRVGRKAYCAFPILFVKTVMRKEISTQNYWCAAFCFVMVVRKGSLLSTQLVQQGRRKGDLVLLHLHDPICKCICGSYKCTLLPADSPNWKMGEVSVCEKLGIHLGLGLKLHLLTPYGSSITELKHVFVFLPSELPIILPSF